MELGTDVQILGDYEKTAVGSVKHITGLDNLREAIYRRVITVPGEVIHRPQYGVGIRKFLNKPCTEANQAELTNLIKLNIRNEERIEKINTIQCIWYQDVASILISVVAYGRTVEFDYRVVKL